MTEGADRSEGEYLLELWEKNICPTCGKIIRERSRVGSGRKSDGGFCSLDCYGRFHEMALLERSRHIAKIANDSNQSWREMPVMSRDALTLFPELERALRSSATTGILPSQVIRQLIDSGRIAGEIPAYPTNRSNQRALT